LSTWILALACAQDWDSSVSGDNLDTLLYKVAMLEREGIRDLPPFFGGRFAI
jgi:hypothetical protein